MPLFCPKSSDGCRLTWSQSPVLTVAVKDDRTWPCSLYGLLSATLPKSQPHWAPGCSFSLRSVFPSQGFGRCGSLRLDSPPLDSYMACSLSYFGTPFKYYLINDCFQRPPYSPLPTHLTPLSALFFSIARTMTYHILSLIY